MFPNSALENQKRVAMITCNKNLKKQEFVDDWGVGGWRREGPSPLSILQQQQNK